MCKKLNWIKGKPGHAKTFFLHPFNFRRARGKAPGSDNQLRHLKAAQRRDIEIKEFSILQSHNSTATAHTLHLLSKPY